MVRPCGARGFVDLVDAVLHYCIRPLIGASAPGPHGYQRASDLILGQASNGLVGSPVFARAGKTDYSIVVSSSRRPRRVTLAEARSSIIPCFMLFLCSCLAAVPSSRPAGAKARRAQGRSRLAVAMTSPLALVFRGHALTGLSTARGSSGSRHCCIGLDVLEGTPVMEDRPGDAGEFVGERNRQHVVVQPFFGCLDPRLEAIALPLLGPDLDQHDPGCLNEQRAQIPIAAPRYVAEDRSVASRHLFWHQSEPGAEVAAFRKWIAGADRGHHCARNDRADAGHAHQSRAALVLPGQCFDLAGEALDAFIQPAPVSGKVLDDAQYARREHVGALGQDVW